MKIQHGLNLLKKRLKLIKRLKIIDKKDKKKLKYMIKIIKETKYNIIKYMKDIKIFQHMILIILVIYQNHLYQIMIICNIRLDMFIITEIYGNTSEKRIRFITNKA